MIPAYCSTRWSVKYDILKAFADQAEEIFKVTANCHGHIYFIKNKLTRNDLDNAKEMIELLHPFKILTEVLSRKNNYPFVYVPVLIYMRDHLQKMNTKYATSDKFNPTKAIEKTIKYLRTTSNNNRILYLCGLFFLPRQNVIMENIRSIVGRFFQLWICLLILHINWVISIILKF
ncbi:hypothetical protein MOUN0_E05468 [Monosporozyma unispora]